MSKKTKHYGHNTGGLSSDRYLSPQHPYTGDGKTSRSIFDGIRNVFRKPNGDKA